MCPDNTAASHPEGERLQKVLAAAGVASRRASEQLILAGSVSVNGPPGVRTRSGTRPKRGSSDRTATPRPAAASPWATWGLLHSSSSGAATPAATSASSSTRRERADGSSTSRRCRTSSGSATWSSRASGEAGATWAQTGSTATGTDRSVAVDLGGSYSINSRLELTGGVRYRSEKDQLMELSDNRRDSQAVYVGTAFRF